MGGVLGDVERVREVRYDGPDEEERGTFGQEERDSGTDVRRYVSRERDFTFPGGRFREDGESGRDFTINMTFLKSYLVGIYMQEHYYL